MKPAAIPAVETPGWNARLRLGFHQGVRRTELSERERHGPLTVQRPFYPEGDHCHVYLLHPPGGVVGGDSLEIDVHANSGSGALITTPGAAKFYQSAGDTATQQQRLRVDRGATLEWLPQENIFFPGARVSMQTRLDAHPSAAFAWWEIHCLGRPVIGETFDHGEIDNRFALYREGIPVLLERTRINQRTRNWPALAAGNSVLATFVMSGCDQHSVDDCLNSATQHQDTDTQDYIEHSLGLTLIDDLLVARYLGNDTLNARKIFSAFWQRLREPCLQRVPVYPRIWMT